MQEDKFAKLTVRVDAACNIELEIEFCDEHYTVCTSPDIPTTPTGLTKLFELVPDVKSLPGFVGRWDDRDNSIDVDPESRDCIDRDLWKGEKGGYRGHHAATLRADPRINQIDIATPNAPVFRARASLNLEIGVRTDYTLRAGFGCDAEVVPKK
jgi:hypothetical protein